MANDDIWDSWEDFADSGDIDKHVEQNLKISNGSRSTKKDKNDSKQTNGNEKISSQKDGNDTQLGIRILQRPVMMVHEEDQHRTPFIPQLKILKRPDKSSEQLIAEEQKKRLQAQQPVKTLAQREAAYAEARQRIMGVEAKKSNECVGKTSNGDVRPENLKRYSKQSKSQQNGHAGGVQRQPKGPGNGKGFKRAR